MLWIKKNIYAKMFFAFCIFFANHAIANTLRIRSRGSRGIAPSERVHAPTTS